MNSSLGKARRHWFAVREASPHLEEVAHEHWLALQSLVCVQREIDNRNPAPASPLWRARQSCVRRLDETMDLLLKSIDGSGWYVFGDHCFRPLFDRRGRAFDVKFAPRWEPIRRRDGAHPKVAGGGL